MYIECVEPYRKVQDTLYYFEQELLKIATSFTEHSVYHKFQAEIRGILCIFLFEVADHIQTLCVKPDNILLLYNFNCYKRDIFSLHLPGCAISIHFMPEFNRILNLFMNSFNFLRIKEHKENCQCAVESRLVANLEELLH